METAPYPEEIFGSILGSESDNERIEIDAVGSLYHYSPDSPIREVVHAIKYRGCRGLAEELGFDTGRTLAIFPEFHSIDVVIPIPLHPARYRERGYNQAEMIARGVARGLQVPMAPRALRRDRHTGTQTTLDNDARRRNVDGAFRGITDDIRDRVVLLCDDVLTTGATLRSAARALLQAGAASVVGGTLAFDDISGPTVGPIAAIPIP
jgi:ComF family protein